MQPDSFVHLHVHSKFSLNDGVASVEALVEAAAQKGMAALALTDHNSVAGVVRFYRACRERGVQPIYGAELDVLPAAAETFNGKTFRAVVLAENESGYGNLVWLVSEALRNQRPDAPPHVSLRRLAEKKSGLIIMTGGRRSELFWLLSREDIEGSSAHVEALVEALGRERLAVEISDLGQSETPRTNGCLAEVAGLIHAPLVATNDVHYLLPEDEWVWHFLRSDAVQGPIPPAGALSNRKTRHLATGKEMGERLPGYEAALRQTAELAARCRAPLLGERRRFPVHDFERGRDADSDLWDRAFQRATQIYGGLTDRLKERLNVELDYIRREGLADYYQLLCQLSRRLADEHITRGTGQGKLLTSMVAYVLGLTEIDPLEYKLQFFGEQPAPPPDGAAQAGAESGPPIFSIALPRRPLDQVFRYLQDTYGRNHVARVGKHVESHKGKLFAQLCDWAQLPKARVHELISQGILDGRGRRPERLADLLDQAGSAITIKNPKFLAYLVSRLHPRLLPLKPSEGRIVISGEELDRVTPRFVEEGQDVAQIEAEDLLAFGLPQIHLETNGLLNVLDDALRWIRLEHGKEVDLSAIPLDDEETFDLLGAGKTNGVTPFESATLKVLLRKHNPRTLPQLVKVKLELAPDDERVTTDEFTNIFMECLLGYRCAYLKARFPVSYMTAILNNTLRNRKDFAVLWREVERMGIRPYALNINNSPYEFTQANLAIRVGLRVVHLLGEKAFEEIERVRRGGDFADLADFCRRTDPKLVTRALIENLIRTGAFDCFGQSRAQMLLWLPSILETYRPKAAEGEEASSLFVAMGVEVEAPETETETPETAEAPLQNLLNDERRIAGFVITRSPLDPYRDYLRKCQALLAEQLGPKMDGKRIFVAGHVDHTDRDGPALEASSVLLMDFDGVSAQARHPEAEKFASAVFSDLPVLVGGKARMRGADPVLLLTYCATLRDLAAQARLTRRVVLNLSSEDKATLKYLHATLRRYPGETPVETRGYRGGGFAGRWLSRIEATKVFWCPPLADELRQIIPEECISVETEGDV